MRFYLACIVVLIAMLLGLHECRSQEFMMVSGPVQADKVNSVKGGGEAQKRLHRHHRSPRATQRRYYALSAAVSLPRPRPDIELLHPELYPRLDPADGEALAVELWTPQQRINSTFELIGWKE